MWHYQVIMKECALQNFYKVRKQTKIADESIALSSPNSRDYIFLQPNHFTPIHHTMYAITPFYHTTSRNPKSMYIDMYYY